MNDDKIREAFDNALWFDRHAGIPFETFKAGYNSAHEEIDQLKKCIHDTLSEFEDQPKVAVENVFYIIEHWEAKK